MKLFLSKLLRPGISGEERQIYARIRPAVEAWVRGKGYHKALATVEEIAADIGVHPDRLGVYVRMMSGRSLLSWRKSMRIEDAKVLLVEFPDLPLAAVAKMVGIEDKSNFRKQFLEETGMTPRAWRERHRK